MRLRFTVGLSAVVVCAACDASSDARFNPDPASFESRTLPVGPSNQERVIAVVDGGFFGSVRAYVGRTFVRADRSPDVDVAVLSYRFWSEELASEPSVIGTEISVGGIATTIIGVMPSGIDVPPGVALWIPRHAD